MEMDGVEVLDQSATGKVVAFMLTGQEYCLPVNNIREIRSWASTTPIPGSPNYVLGLINLRGEAMPIIDLAVKIGGAKSIPTDRHAIIVLEIGGKLMGILVDSVSEIIAIDAEQLRPTPELANGPVGGVVESILLKDTRTISVLNLSCIE